MRKWNVTFVIENSSKQLFSGELVIKAETRSDAEQVFLSLFPQVLDVVITEAL